MRQSIFSIQSASLALLFAIVGWCSFAEPVRAQATPFPYPQPAILGGTIMFSGLLSGKQPTNLGINNGQLTPCPNTPNCVSSQSQDQDHKIEALSYQGDSTAAFSILKKIVQNMERTKIVAEDSHYLYAEFTSAMIGFVDDVEFYLDEAAQVIQVRSASRLGQSDLGVNRKRVEAIRTQLQTQSTSA